MGARRHESSRHFLVIFESSSVPVEEFERLTGWELNDRGACKGEVCVPLAPETRVDGVVDISLLASQLAMPVVHDEKHSLWSLGPQSGGRALTSASAPPLVLHDLEGRSFELRSLLGQKVLLVAWASW